MLSEETRFTHGQVQPFVLKAWNHSSSVSLVAELELNEGAALNRRVEVCRSCVLRMTAL